MANASAGGLAYVTAGGAGGNGAAITIGGNTAGAGALISTGTLVLAGGNNITLSQNGQSLTISGAAAGGAATASVYGTGNTTQSSSGTVALSSLLFNALGEMSVGYSNGSIQLSAPPSSLGVSGGNTSGTSGTFSGQMVLAGGTNITLSASAVGANQTISILAPATSSIAATGLLSLSVNASTISLGVALSTNTAITGFASVTLDTAGDMSFNGSGLAGTNTAKTGNIAFSVNSSGVSINASSLVGTGFSTTSFTGGNITGAANSAGLTISNPYFVRSIFPQDQLAAISAPGNASLSVQYVPVDSPVTGTRIDALVALSGGSSATTNTGALVFSVYMGISTRNVSTLSSLSSGSTQTTYTYASNTAGQTQLTASALRPISCPLNFNFAPGEYFVGVNIITATSSIGLSTTNMGLSLSMYGGVNAQTALPYAEITANTATSTNLWGGQGVYTAATTGMPVSIGLANIAQTGASQAQANIALVFRNV